MATQTIEFRAASGLTLTAELFAIGSDTIVATVSPTEQTNRAGTYRAAYTDVAAGEYQLVAFSGTTPVASWLVTLTLTTATFQTYDRSTAINMVSQPLDAAGTRSAIGLATANLDTQLAALPTASENAEAVQTELTPEFNSLLNQSPLDAF